eukprot:EC690172.1.p6 GENE.EC690172.1~~EC690172.1.p6  ORF type:complete len:51 (-),score=8.85 EC690172.1:457-582(-)
MVMVVVMPNGVPQAQHFVSEPTPSLTLNLKDRLHHPLSLGR